MLLLEDGTGSHLNPTQSRFSRFASGESDSSSAFGMTSRMFRNSAADPAFMPAYPDPFSRHGLPAEGPAHSRADVQSESQTLEGYMAAGSGEYGHESLDFDRHVVHSVSNSARSCATQEGKAEALAHSQQLSSHTGKRSTVTVTDGQLSSSRQWHQPRSEQQGSPQASSSSYVDANVADFAQSMFNPELDQGSPQNDAAVRQDCGIPCEPDMQYSWSAQSQSYASSAGSPGRDSLHSWTGSTPARPIAQQDPASPDARTILRSIAQDCQNAVAGRSPAPGLHALSLSPQSPSRPDLSRTPNSFYNPSFDADEELAKSQ